VARSAVVVVVAAAEPAVGELRLAHDPMAARGVPAHVTILYPFRSTVDAATADEVAAIAVTTEPFTATFSTVCRFPGEVVYLAPDDAAAFASISRRFIAAFPDCPPYGGAHPEPIPHLTVGSRAQPADADRIEAALVACLPISTRVEQLTLLVEDDDGQWTIDRTWPLGQQ